VPHYLAKSADDQHRDVRDERGFDHNDRFDGHEWSPEHEHLLRQRLAPALDLDLDDDRRGWRPDVRDRRRRAVQVALRDELER
jgi:hypothetical protein